MIVFWVHMEVVIDGDQKGTLLAERKNVLVEGFTSVVNDS